VGNNSRKPGEWKRAGNKSGGLQEQDYVTGRWCTKQAVPAARQQGLLRLKAHRQIQSTHMLGQRADRDIIHTGLGDVPNRRFGDVA